MGRFRAAESGTGGRGKAEEGRAREKVTKDHLSKLGACLNVEESMKLHEALAQFTLSEDRSPTQRFGSSRNGSFDNLYREGAPNNAVLSNPVLRSASPARGSQLPKQNQAKNSLTQLLRNTQGKAGESNKTLVMVNVRGSVGPIRVLIDAQATAHTVVGVVLQTYAREQRQPVLGLDRSWFDLYPGPVVDSEALDPLQSIKVLNVRTFTIVKRQSQRIVAAQVQEKTEVVVKSTSTWLEDVWGFSSWWWGKAAPINSTQILV